MNIETANIKDAREILELQQQAYQSEAVIYNDYTIPPLTQSLEELEAEFQTKIFLKATVDGKIIGSVRGYIRDDTCFIGRLIVQPDMQNRGIGTSLLKAIEDHFNHARRYELFTGNKSERNLCLYRKAGYQIFRTEQLTDLVSVLYMEKVRVVNMTV